MHDAHVVVVEDDQDVRGLYVEVLSKLGGVVGFGDIYQALAHLRYEHCDLLVLDLLLPGATGVDLVERQKRNRKEPSEVARVRRAWAQALARQRAAWARCRLPELGE